MSRAGRIVAASVLVLISVFAVDAGRYLVFRSHAFAGKIDGTGFYAQDRSNGRMLRYLTDAPSGIVLEKIHEDFPNDTGIYGSFAQKPNLVGLPYALGVCKKELPELPALVAKIDSFYAGTFLDAARFLTDHDVATSSGPSAKARTLTPGRASCRRSIRLPLDGVFHHAKDAYRPLDPPLTAALRRRR
jgi:hypothetical protein